MNNIIRYSTDILRRTICKKVNIKTKEIIHEFKKYSNISFENYSYIYVINIYLRYPKN